MSYHWPGNVRELKSALEYAFVVVEKNVIGLAQRPPRFTPHQALTLPGGDTISSLAITEKEELIEALRQTGGNQTQAAKILGINRVTVWNRMKKYGIDLKKVLSMPE
jgi:transcriptional regulator of acetoin/glycerol metabolism